MDQRARMVHFHAPCLQPDRSRLLWLSFKVTRRPARCCVHKTIGFLFHPFGIVLGEFYSVDVFVWTFQMDLHQSTGYRPGKQGPAVPGLLFRGGCGRRSWNRK